MARVEIPIQEIGAHGGGVASLSFVAADAANGHYFDNTSGKVILVAFCETASDALTVKSVADPYGRTSDEVITLFGSGLPGGGGPYPAVAFNQRGTGELGRVHVDITTGGADMYLAALKYTDPR